MPDQLLEWTDPTNGYATRLDVLYTDVSGGTPGTVLDSVAVGVEQYTVPAASAPAGRRFAVRGVNASGGTDVAGPLSNIVQVPSGAAGITADADWAYHAKDWDGVAATIPSAVAGGPDATHSGLTKANDGRDYFDFTLNDFLRIAASAATEVGTDDATWVFVVFLSAAISTQNILINNRYGDVNTTQGAGYRHFLNTDQTARGSVNDGTTGAFTTTPSFPAGVVTVIRIVRDAAAGTLQGFVDGTAGTAVAAPTGDLTSGQAVYIGKEGGAVGTDSNGFKGRLYAAGFWRGRKLTQAEAATFNTESQA